MAAALWITKNQADRLRNLPATGSDTELAHNPSVDDFFRRLKQDSHHPKPGTEAIAAALQAVQRLASQVDTDASVSAVAEAAGSRTCPSCGSPNPIENRFCAICGVPQKDAPPLPAEASMASDAKPEVHAPGQASLSPSLSPSLCRVLRERRFTRWH